MNIKQLLSRVGMVRLLFLRFGSKPNRWKARRHKKKHKRSNDNVDKSVSHVADVSESKKGESENVEKKEESTEGY